MASRQGFGPSRRDLGMVSAAEIAATGRREEVARLAALVGPRPVPPKQEPARNRAGIRLEASKAGRAGSRSGHPVRNAGKPSSKPSGKTGITAAKKTTASKAAASKTTTSRSKPAVKMPKLSKAEEDNAMRMLATMHPGWPRAQLQERLAGIVRRAAGERAAAAMLAALIAGPSPVQASGSPARAVVTFTDMRPRRPLWGARLAPGVRLVPGRRLGV